MPDDNLGERVTELETTLRDHLKDADALVAEFRQDVASIRAFHERYDRYLSEALEHRQRGEELRRAVVKSTVITAVWAGVAFLSWLIWDYVVRTMKGLP